MRESAERGIRLTLWTTAANVALAAVKIVGGALGSSHVLIADGVESVTDVVGSIVVTGGLRIAAIPPDKEHPYGHGKAESLAALVVSVALVLTAVGIAIQSLREVLGRPHDAPAPAVFTLYILIGAVIIKETMFRLMQRTGQSIGSEAVKVTAWHHRADAISSGAAFIGILVALIGGRGYEQADGWAALVACAVIAYNGIRLFRGALDEMMDKAPPPEIESRIRGIARSIPDVAAIEKCRVRRSGLSLFVEIHVEVDGNLTVRRGHQIAHKVKQALLEAQLSIIDVIVHIEPAGG
ncbi:MAG TPA: cation diffusion facilitator family transporter [Pirellulales bacterium]|nr:cation diffusion facilitator family transporter [Pirellulales bacterium]